MSKPFSAFIECVSTCEDDCSRATLKRLKIEIEFACHVDCRQISDLDVTPVLISREQLLTAVRNLNLNVVEL